MKRRVGFRPEARRDLAEIWTYTAEQWDAEQAERYTKHLRERLTAVARNPHLGSDCGEIYPELRRIKCGSHLIYYLADEDMLDVVRILHQRRDSRSLIG